ncbi:MULTISPECIES: FmdB family zinc ribbon protein [unclassified Variovorax]|uniref:FmdB family zinc ribbon protein n=1 Tax=unclassified Variovorax TaxID=663243 RepID=UPI003F44DB79
MWRVGNRAAGSSVPTYDYACPRCGPFVERRPMALFDRPAPCPACGSESGRVLSMPASLGTRRSAEEPRHAAAQSDGSNYRRLQAGGVCACCPRANA